MQEIIYTGEHLLPGQIGHFSIILSFVALAFSIFSYWKQTKSNEISAWNSLGRAGFVLHCICLLTLIMMLFYVMKNQMYEYVYAQAHVSDDLPMKYILSAFWEGQEGSFLLWMFWHAFMGLLLIKSAKHWEAPVLVVLGLIQIFIHSMILGLHIEIGDFIYKVGSNPTLLLRDTMDAPIFQNADYLSMIKGDGLNPLLQNFWMTIHPPTIFFGFASVSIPFAFAIAGFWKKDYKGWLEPCLRWSLVSGTMLGLGIFMGCVWAYIALTFGGYWAWDPVENMSLVPWLFMVAGIHALLIAKSTGYSIRSGYIMFSLSFITLLYSTFLTRSGVLGDTSVHAFTEMGLEWQLVSFIAFFAAMALITFIKTRKIKLNPPREESIYSKEFWMQIGVLILMFSSFLITVSTSVPVYNKIMEFFNPDFIGKVIMDPVAHHNKYQLWIAVFIALFSAKVLFLRFGEFNGPSRIKKFALINLAFALLGGILTYLFAQIVNYYQWHYCVLAFACFYSLSANVYYLFLEAKFQPKRINTVMAHMGFALMILGSITSGLNKKVISSNPFAQEGVVQDENLGKVIQLIKDKPFFVRDYWLTYESDTTIGHNRIFKIRFDRQDEKGNIVETFHVNPDVLYSNDLTKVAAQNPDTKHYLGSDIFTYIAGLPGSQMDVTTAKEEEDSLKYDSFTLGFNDTIDLKEAMVVLQSIEYTPVHKDYKKEENDFGVGLKLKVLDKEKQTEFNAAPMVSVHENLIFDYPAIVNDLNLKFKLNEHFLEKLFTPENELDYENFYLKQGEKKTIKGYTVELNELSNKIEHRNYTAQDGDIAIAADLNIRKSDYQFACNPVYVIRGSRPYGIKEYDSQEGLHVRFVSINPDSELFEFKIAKDNRDLNNIPIDIAQNVPRKDIIILSAQRFPGINLFWLGCSMMIFGLFFAFLSKMKADYA